MHHPPRGRLALTGADLSALRIAIEQMRKDQVLIQSFFIAGVAFSSVPLCILMWSWELNFATITISLCTALVVGYVVFGGLLMIRRAASYREANALTAAKRHAGPFAVEISTSTVGANSTRHGREVNVAEASCSVPGADVSARTFLQMGRA